MRKLIKSNRKVYFTTVKGNKYRIYRRMDLYKTSKNKNIYASDQPYNIIETKELKRKGLKKQP